MKLVLVVLIATHVRSSSSQTEEDPIDCSVYRGLNITWKVKSPSIQRSSSQNVLRSGVNARIGPSELPIFYHFDWGQLIPEEFDARQKWSNCESIKEIRDQGNCNSCWAVSSASVMSDRICIRSSGKNQIRISALDLMSCCEECSEGICKTGWPSSAFTYWGTTGIVTGGEDRLNQTSSCRPYPAPVISEEIQCTTECNIDSNLIYEADRRYGMNPIRLLPDQRQIQLEIMKNGPVVAAMFIYTSYFCYESGIYHKIDGVDGPEPRSGHAVKIIGWGVENDMPYWLISDTHGESFGESGTFRILRGTDDCFIESWEIVAGFPRCS